MAITPPVVLYKKDEKTGKIYEPIEKVKIEVNPKYSPSIIEKMAYRKGIYENCVEITKDLHRYIYNQIILILLLCIII